MTGIEVFRGRFTDGLRQRRGRGELGPDDGLPALFHRLRQHDWVVHAKPPIAGPESVLRTLGRYTHRIALSNRRILRAALDARFGDWEQLTLQTPSGDP